MNELESRLRAVPEGDLSIAVGALALGIASIVAVERVGDSWAAFPLFLLLAIPCAVLLSLGLAFARKGGRIGARADGRLAPWQTACLLVGLPLLVASFIQLLVVLGKDSPGSGTATWIFVLAGLGALWLSTRSESPGLTLLAALFFAVAGLTAINWIDSNAQVATYRDVLLIEGVLFLFAARQVWDARRAEANVLIGLAGAALIGGAVLGDLGNPLNLILGIGDEQDSSDGWELVLIVVSIGLLAYSAWQRHGGLAFIGATGAFAFFGFAGTEGNLAGWPLLLGLLAVGCLAWALVVRPGRSSEAGTTSAPPPTPPPT